MAKRTKVAIGIAGYGTQAPKWWIPLALMTGNLYKEGLEFDDIYFSGVSNPDVNRNNVVDEFLTRSDADYLWWIDTDNPPKIGMASRLLSHKLPMVSGLYYSGDPNQPEKLIAIAYLRNKIGRYYPVNHVREWEVGEVFQVDAVGAGCLLTHRSVYEDMKDNFVEVNRQSGGMMLVHKDNMKGKRGGDTFSTRSRMGKVYDGVLYDPVIEAPTDGTTRFPFFLCQWNRTEDLVFCENAKALGYEIWLDTACEVGHVKDDVLVGDDYRKGAGLVPDMKPEEVEYVGQGS
jgi:hypothetical protein